MTEKALLPRDVRTYGMDRTDESARWSCRQRLRRKRKTIVNIGRLLNWSVLYVRRRHFRPKDSASKRCTRCWQAIADSHTPASGRNDQRSRKTLCFYFYEKTQFVLIDALFDWLDLVKDLEKHYYFYDLVNVIFLSICVLCSNLDVFVTTRARVAYFVCAVFCSK